MAKFKLEDVCEIITDGTHKTPEYCEDGGYIFLSSKDVTSRKINWNDVKHIPEKLHNELYSRLAPRKDDILLAKNGTTGVAAIVDRDEVFDIYVSLALLRPKKSVFPKYLLYAVNSPIAKRQFNAGLKGIGVPNLHLSVIRRTEIEIPEIEIQMQICDKLERLVSIIEKREQELELLDNLIKSRFVEMFDGKYPEDTLLNLCNIIDYRGKTPEKVESGLPFITAKNVKMHHMTLEPREYISEETYDRVMVRGFPKEGDVVFTTEAPLGNVCRIPHFGTKFYIGQRIVTMQTEQLNPIYLEYALSDDEFMRKYMGKSSGSTVTGIRVRLLEQLTIPVPPRELQNEFATFVNQVDKLKFEVQKSLDETQLLMDSLMQEYFG